MRALHDVLAWVVVFSCGFSGAWIAAAHSQEWARHQAMWWFAHAAHLTVAVQVTVGVWLVSAGGVEIEQFHVFYGFLTLVGVGLIIGYRGLAQYRYLLYGLGNLFVMGLAIRAMILNQG